MRARVFVIFIATWSLLSGCATTKPTAQADPNSIIREPESDHEVHGEVGMTHGASAR
jgi:uncharacterized protein YceK